MLLNVLLTRRVKHIVEFSLSLPNKCNGFYILSLGILGLKTIFLNLEQQFRGKLLHRLVIRAFGDTQQCYER